jgi:hypothetical protein
MQMKTIDPIEALRQANGDSPAMLEQAEVHSAAYGIASAPDSRGLPVKDARFSNGGGYSATVTNGRGDDVPYPVDVARVDGVTTHATDPVDFGHTLTPVPEDGFGAAASGVDNIIRNGRG